MKTLTNRSFSSGMFIFLLILNTVSTIFARELVITANRSEMSNWCWAAVSQMVLSWYMVNKTQTEIVQKVYVLPDDETLPLYGNVGYLGVNKILEYYASDKIGRITHTNGILSKSDIFTEINGNRPIPILGQNDFGSDPKYHIALIIGYVDNNPNNPIIIVNDPKPGRDGGRKEIQLTYLQISAGDWEWQETIRLQKSGAGSVGVLSGVQIAGADLFTYTQPASSRTYSGNFIRSSPGAINEHPVEWTWSLLFYHTGGDYVVSSSVIPNPNWGLTTQWTAPAFTLPQYQWLYNEDGSVKGALRLKCIDEVGITHRSATEVAYFKPNPYPVTMAYVYNSISGALSEIKAHELVILQNLQINSNANVTFRAGSTIDIKEGVNIENGAVTNLIVDAGVRY